MRPRVIASTFVLGLAGAGLFAGSASAARSCASVKDPYAGTRYAGEDLTRIRATGVSCKTARKVARGGHGLALGRAAQGPIVRVTWKGWKVSGDLRGDHDTYFARKNGDVVRWRF